MIDVVGFFKKNRHKKLTLAVWFYAAWYRFCIRFISPKKLSPHWGIRGEESAETASMEQYRYAKLVSSRVNRSANNTPWESKCLVRALTAQRLLKRKKIERVFSLAYRMIQKRSILCILLPVQTIILSYNNVFTSI